MVKLNESLLWAHNSLSRVIDYLFPPRIGHENEISYWDAFWDKRLRIAEQTGIIYEHNTPGKRWLYERVIETVRRCAGGSLAGRTVAEYGAGSGYGAIRMAEHGASPVIIDTSEAALRYARYIAERLDLVKHIVFIRSDLCRNDLNIKSFDVCFNSGVLEHYKPEVAVVMLRQMIRVTRIGGVVLVVLPNLLAPVLISRMLRDHAKGSERFYTPWLLGQLFAAAGLHNSRFGYMNALLPVETSLKLLEIIRKAKVEKWAGPLSTLFFRWAVVSEGCHDV